MSSTPSIILVVELEIAPGRMDEFLDVIAKHGAYSVENEEGCLRFEVLRPREEGENRVILVEAYTDDAALESHWSSDHMNRYRERTKDMIAGRTPHRCDVVPPAA